MKKIFAAGPWITEHEIRIVEDAMRHWYENAYDYVEKFEKEFAAWHNRKYALMTPNCTSAIHLLLRSIGIGEGDEVIVPDCTWIATASPISYQKAVPVFCDIDPMTWCLSPKSIESCITKKTKAIIAVDIFGNMPDMDKLLALAKKHNLYLIEDAAEALGSSYKGLKAGKFGVGSVFSFHRTKTLTTGEGGMLLLDDENIYEKAKVFRDHGRREKGPLYYNYEVGYKYMPFNVQAALGWAQLQRIDELLAKKRWILEEYRKGLTDIPDILLNVEPEGGINGAWITGLVFGKSHKISKLQAMEKLQKLNIPARPFFYPLSSLPAYPGLQKIYESKNPVTYDISSRGINLPGALNLDQEQIDYICKCVKQLL